MAVLKFWKLYLDFEKAFDTTVYIFYYILHLPLNINEAVHVGKSAHRLIRTAFQSHLLMSGMVHNLVPAVLLLKCVWEWDGNTHVG